MIKLKQYAAPSAPTVSIESELQQLESVVIALEAAQNNPDVETLLFGPSIGLESDFGTKVKDTAKKLWEALVAIIKKLFSWGRDVEGDVEELKKKAKEQERSDLNISTSAKEQHRDLEEKMRSAKTLSELTPFFAKNFRKDYPDVHWTLLETVMDAYCRYVGHPLYGKDVRKFGNILTEFNKFVASEDDTNLIKAFKDALSEALDRTTWDPETDSIRTGISILVRRSYDYRISKSINFDETIFTPHPNDLISASNDDMVLYHAWKDVVDTMESTFENLEAANTVPGNKFNTNHYKDVVMLGRLFIERMRAHTTFVDRVLKYRKHFVE